jgi:2-oxoglutarate-Fe(II)-dependent oxygenase superfamily protein
VNVHPSGKTATPNSSSSTVCDLWRWPTDLFGLRERFLSAPHYPHLVVDDVFPREALLRLYSDVPVEFSPLWTHWGSGGQENCSPENSKRGISSLMLLSERISGFLKLLNDERFLQDIREITGEPNLTADHTLNGGGLHCTGPGGHLRIHADKVRHPRPSSFDQSVNLLLYINPYWSADFGGDFELWSRDCSERIASIPVLFNRLVLFKSDRSTYHGHPEPIRCPVGMYRTSLAVYYYVPRNTPFISADNEVDYK